MARLLRFRERLVEVLDPERQVVEPFPDDVVRREAGPFLVVVQLEDNPSSSVARLAATPFVASIVLRPRSFMPRTFV